MMDFNKAKNEMLKRITIEYQIYDGELDDYDYMTMSLKSEMAKHKLCSKDTDKIIGVNPLFMRELQKSGIEKGHFLSLIEDLQELYKFRVDDFSYIKQFSHLMRKYGDDLFLYPLKYYDYEYNELINLYMRCIYKSSENMRKCINEASDIIDIALERINMNDNFDKLQKIKYFCQRLRFECLHYYQNERYKWRYTDGSKLEHSQAIINPNQHILKKWFGANNDYMNYSWLNKNQKALITNVINLDLSNVEYHRNHKREYDISKKYICKLINTDYNSFKNKVSAIKSKNVNNGVEIDYRFNAVYDYHLPPIKNFEEYIEELQDMRENDWVEDDEEYEYQKQKSDEIKYCEGCWSKIKSYY